MKAFKPLSIATAMTLSAVALLAAAPAAFATPRVLLTLAEIEMNRTSKSGFVPYNLVLELDREQAGSLVAEDGDSTKTSPQG